MNALGSSSLILTFFDFLAAFFLACFSFLVVLLEVLWDSLELELLLASAGVHRRAVATIIVTNRPIHLCNPERTMKLLEEGEEDCGDDEHKGDDVVPLQGFVIEDRRRDDGKYGQGDGFLDDLELHEAEGTSVDAATHGVRGNHEEVFDERHTPRGQDDQNERPVGADVHFLELEVAVPGGGHKDIADNQEDNGKDSDFHDRFSLVVGAQAVRLACAELIGEACADLFQVSDVFFALVVAVSPVEGMKMPVLKIQRGFYENASLHVHALALVLSGGQEELPEGHVARVQIYGAQSRRSILLGDFQFHIVAPELDVDDGLAVYQRFVAEKGPHRCAADFFDVVVGKGEGERREG